MPRPRKYPQELIDRGVRLAIESGRPVAHVAADIGLPSETLRKAVRRAEADQGSAPGSAHQPGARGDQVLANVRFELRRANEILKAASVFFATGSMHTVRSERVHDEHRERFGVEPICQILGVSASAYYQRATGERSNSSRG